MQMIYREIESLSNLYVTLSGISLIQSCLVYCIQLLYTSSVTQINSFVFQLNKILDLHS